MVEIKHLCLCLLFSSTHFSVYKDTFAFYKDTKCVQGHAILMPVIQFELYTNCLLLQPILNAYTGLPLTTALKIFCKSTILEPQLYS